MGVDIDEARSNYFAGRVDLPDRVVGSVAERHDLAAGDSDVTDEPLSARAVVDGSVDDFDVVHGCPLVCSCDALIDTATSEL